MSKKILHNTITMDKLKYPIGGFSYDEASATHGPEDWINDIASFPQQIAGLTAELSDADLARTYRPGGWNIRQIVHHCADSHMNAFIRFRLALTEEYPSILPYKQAEWSNLADSLLPIASSIHILAGLHERWTVMLRKVTPQQLSDCGYMHPEFEGKVFSLEEALALYSWHGRHHLAHIETALKD